MIRFKRENMECVHLIDKIIVEPRIQRVNPNPVGHLLFITPPCRIEADLQTGGKMSKSL